MHKVSRDIVRYCQGHRVGTLVLGVNRGWKHRTSLGSANNQKFVQVPLYMLRAMVRYKAEAAGIRAVEQEESYTSKADVTAGDYIPVYGKDDEKACFSGRRIRRGLYRCYDGLAINADCNGAANILRKAFPDAWGGRTDFRFLAQPDVRGFHELNQNLPRIKGPGLRKVFRQRIGPREPAGVCDTSRFVSGMERYSTKRPFPGKDTISIALLVSAWECVVHRNSLEIISKNSCIKILATLYFYTKDQRTCTSTAHTMPYVAAQHISSAAINSHLFPLYPPRSLFQ